MNSIQISVLDLISQNLISLLIDLKERQLDLSKKIKSESLIKKFDFDHKKVSLDKLRELYPYIAEVSELKSDKETISTITNAQKKIVRDFVSSLDVFSDGGDLK